MTQVDRSALVLHSAEQMFQIVNDVAAYPEYLPWCSGTEILSKSENEMVATLHLAKAGMSYSFTTRNQLTPPHRLEVVLEEGPFEHLAGVWTFDALSEEACKVSLALNFSFAGKLTSLAMGKVFNQVATTMVDAFVQRADDVFGDSL